MSSAAIGVDVGGTFTKIAAVDRSGKIRLQQSLPSQVADGPAAFVDRVCGVVEAWMEREKLKILGVGLGLAGDVDSAKGELRFTPNLRGWGGFPFKRALERRLSAKVVVDNDANAAIWGGYCGELRRKPSDVVGVTLGTGVGGGIVVGGKLLRGATGSAGEVGHLKVMPDGEACHCGGKGCLEAYAGSYGILKTARRLIARHPRRARRLLEIAGSAETLEPKHLTQAADAGDPVAQEVWLTTGQMLGVGLEDLVLVMNPDVILILGGVSRAGRWLLDPIEAHLATSPFRTPFSKVRVKMADNPNAGCVGAALLALEP